MLRWPLRYAAYVLVLRYIYWICGIALSFRYVFCVLCICSVGRAFIFVFERRSCSHTIASSRANFNDQRVHKTTLIKLRYCVDSSEQITHSTVVLLEAIKIYCELCLMKINIASTAMLNSIKNQRTLYIYMCFVCIYISLLCDVFYFCICIYIYCISDSI